MIIFNAIFLLLKSYYILLIFNKVRSSTMCYNSLKTCRHYLFTQIWLLCSEMCNNLIFTYFILEDVIITLLRSSRAFNSQSFFLEKSHLANTCIMEVQDYFQVYFLMKEQHIQNKNIILNFQIIQYLSIKYTMVDIIEKASAEVETP